MPGALLCQWDPHAIPILAEVSGKVRFEDIIKGETMRVEKDPSGHERKLIMEHKGDLHPQIVLEEDGKILDFQYLPKKAHIEVVEGSRVSAGTLLAKTPREVAGTQDITGGLPRVTEIFEARKPKDPAVIAAIDGIVSLEKETRRGKRTIVVRSESGIEREIPVSHGKHLCVHAGSFVLRLARAVDGPLVPHDILLIFLGEEEVQEYLTREIQNVYRSQRVEINDKHIEIIVSQMLRKVRVESFGDTSLLPGSIMDKFEFRAVNQELAKCLKISHKGDSDFAEGAIVPIESLNQHERPDRGLGRRTGQGRQAQARHRQHAAPGHHQGRRAKLQLHLGRQLPGNDEGAHGGRPGGQDRPPRGPEGERDPRSPDPGRHRFPHLPGVGSPHPSARPGRPGAGKRRHPRARHFPLLEGAGKVEPVEEGDGRTPLVPARWTPCSSMRALAATGRTRTKKRNWWPKWATRRKRGNRLAGKSPFSLGERGIECPAPC